MLRSLAIPVDPAAHAAGSDPAAHAAGSLVLGDQAAKCLCSQALAEIAEVLSTFAFFLETHKQRRQDLDDALARHQVEELEVQSLSQVVSADEQRVLVAAAADDADLALVRSRAAIG